MDRDLELAVGQPLHVLGELHQVLGVEVRVGVGGRQVPGGLGRGRAGEPKAAPQAAAIERKCLRFMFLLLLERWNHISPERPVLATT